MLAVNEIAVDIAMCVSALCVILTLGFVLYCISE